MERCEVCGRYSSYTVRCSECGTVFCISCGSFKEEICHECAGNCSNQQSRSVVLWIPNRG